MITTAMPSGLPASVYSMVLGYGVLIGLWLTLSEFENPEKGFEQLMAMLVGAFTGARIAYVIGAWGYYRNHLPEAISPVRGGFDWFGAVAGALLVSLIIARINKESWFVFLDKTILLWICLSIAVWLNAVLSDTGYGSPIDMGFIFAPEDTLGIATTRISLSFLGLTGSFCLWALFESVLEPRLRDIQGGRFASVMIGLMAIVVLLNTLRDDLSRMMNNLYIDIYLAAGILAIFVFLLGFGWFRYQQSVIKTMHQEERPS